MKHKVKFESCGKNVQKEDWWCITLRQKANAAFYPSMRKQHANESTDPFLPFCCHSARFINIWKLLKNDFYFFAYFSEITYPVKW